MAEAPPLGEAVIISKTMPCPLIENRLSQGVPQLWDWFPKEANVVRWCVLKARSTYQQQVRMCDVTIVGGAGTTDT